MPHDSPIVPDFTNWPTFPFEGAFRVKELAEPVAEEPARQGEGQETCLACQAPDESYIWVSARWRVRALDRPTGLPVVLILESRPHLDLGDLPNLLAAELGVMTVRLERAIRSLDGVARVHVNRWGDGSAHLHLWFMARPYGRLQLRGTFLPLWDDILPAIPESEWRENLALVAAWLAEFGGRSFADPVPLDWQSLSPAADVNDEDGRGETADSALSIDEAAAESGEPHLTEVAIDRADVARLADPAGENTSTTAVDTDGDRIVPPQAAADVKVGQAEPTGSPPVTGDP